LKDNNTYQKLTIRISDQWEDIWIAHCFENGATGIETEIEEDTFSILHIYFTDMSIIPADIVKLFCQQYSTESEDIILINTENHKNKDWLQEWKRFFYPTKVGEKFIVCPPWDIPENNDGFYKIIINPGNGFGSGSHPSTVLALKLLEIYCKNTDNSDKSIIDIGTGSGILLIAAKQLGLEKLIGIDIDLPSIYDAQNNFKINGLNGIQTVCGSPQSIHHHFDIVISNMMLHEISAVKKELKRLMKTTGVLIISGVYCFQKENILKCFKEVEPVLEMNLDDWCGIVFRANHKVLI